VVLDSQINADKMEMYADENSRGGVLEASGIVEIKFRDRDLIKTMHRLDDKLISLSTQLRDMVSRDVVQLQSIKGQIAAREKELLAFYQQMSVKFADLHDTPGRMKAKGVIREVVTWRHARKYFSYRLRRRMFEERWCARMQRAFSSYSHKDALATLHTWIKTANPAIELEDDAMLAAYLGDESTRTLLKTRLKELRSQWIMQKVAELAKEDIESVRAALANFQ